MNLRVILVGTSHSGNIGAVARAMKTFALTELYLVSPKVKPDDKSYALASNAKDILANAKIVKTISQASLGCQRVIGTSNRDRKFTSISLPLRQSMQQLTENYQNVAILFGRENFGLSNDELDYCDEQIFIPANPEYPSLNLAQAVQVVAYEYGQNVLAIKPKPKPKQLITNQEFNFMLGHLENLLIEIEYLNPTEPKLLKRRLKHLFNRVKLTSDELKILRGIFATTQKKSQKGKLMQTPRLIINYVKKNS